MSPVIALEAIGLIGFAAGLSALYVYSYGAR